MILATCGNDLGDDEYCTERVYLETPTDTPPCERCDKRGTATRAWTPRIANAARMHEIADKMADDPSVDHEDEAATLLAYAAGRLEDLERLESDLIANDLDDLRQDGETTSAFVMRLLSAATQRIERLEAQLGDVEHDGQGPQSAGAYPQAILHAG